MKLAVRSFLIFLFFISIELASATDFISITKNVYVHVSYKEYSGVIVPSNGLLVKTRTGFLLLDTAWDEKQTQDILDFVHNKLDSKIVYCIVTHAHMDRVGGISVLLRNKIDVFSTEQTIDLCQKLKTPEGNKVLTIGESNFDGLIINAEYYGAAHSQDNIVVFINSYNIMYAACIAKSIDAYSIGNIEDADIYNWRIVIDKLIEICKKYEYIVIPGHGKIGNIDLLYKTKKLLE